MKVVIAMDSFKGSISSIEANEAVSLGIQDVCPVAEIIQLPLADGGEGMVEALVHATNGRVIKKEVTGPLQKKVESVYGILGDKKTAVIEVAAACGLPLVPVTQRNPLFTTSYGVGELILDAVKNGCREFVIGLGGSATNDAGVGMLMALGYRFLNINNKEIELGGQGLSDICFIDSAKVSPQLKQCTFRVACDVNNPLHGPNGATYVFGPQKGATIKIADQLDNAIKHFSGIVKSQLGMDITQQAGAGAAGGLGAAFYGFLHAELQSGIDLVLMYINMEEKIKGANYVITGEGKLDGQTSMGKAPLGVAKLAKKFGVPVIALAGSVTEETKGLNNSGITAYFSILNQPMNLDEAMNSDIAKRNARVTINQLFRCIEAVKEFDNQKQSV
ncbi:glycerate kinase [Bacillus ectoiniformans]|uniref:glycerate kinase family protein n=1 Tax=Bacillus ectoiniformans TaxID=1494429 RepID=UPI001959247E|nr:glycerate kinase [Bacillus ectoiniformans]MBM7649684.1 glycerate kinase [Bacillus ectoiniformans]